MTDKVDQIKLHKEDSKWLVKWESPGTIILENRTFATGSTGIHLASDPRIRHEYYKNLEDALDRVREITKITAATGIMPIAPQTPQEKAMKKPTLTVDPNEPGPHWITLLKASYEAPERELAERNRLIAINTDLLEALKRILAHTETVYEGEMYVKDIARTVIAKARRG